ncbi:hypothetical protein CO662_23255 [Rhizobium anhuiense]|uniref:Uncharacterized protein n=1 Tax=Rhizobium anhuiense TaxID=1184720 RepID=A0ABX4J6L2_9HYPH|nr:hypothetical protein CO662_23255 [Rhizobium anhuiense]
MSFDLDYKRLAITRSMQLVSETVGTRKRPKFSPANSAVVHSFHMTTDQEGIRNSFVNRKHILRSHNDATLDPDNHRVAAIQDHDIWLMRFQSRCNIFLPDRIASKIDRLCSSHLEYDPARLAEKFADSGIM